MSDRADLNQAIGYAISNFEHAINDRDDALIIGLSEFGVIKAGLTTAELDYVEQQINKGIEHYVTEDTEDTEDLDK
jgi:hypothetical protein